MVSLGTQAEEIWHLAFSQTAEFFSEISTIGAKLFGGFTPVRVVLHGLRRSRLVNPRLGRQATCGGGICHLLGEDSVARPARPQRRPV
jgi:hypothetical protein